MASDDCKMPNSKMTLDDSISHNSHGLYTFIGWKPKFCCWSCAVVSLG